MRPAWFGSVLAEGEGPIDLACDAVIPEAEIAGSLIVADGVEGEIQQVWELDCLVGTTRLVPLVGRSGSDLTSIPKSSGSIPSMTDCLLSTHMLWQTSLKRISLVWLTTLHI